MPDIHVPEIVTDGGPWALHDMPCAICWNDRLSAGLPLRKAVIDVGTAVFHPCWHCQVDGWGIRRKRRWRRAARTQENSR